jgi:cytochrome c
VHFDYLPIGEDLTLIAQGHQKATAQLNGKALIDEKGCKACHAIKEASVGPSYQMVASKYQRSDEVVAYLSNKIINGGGGVWGDRMMAANTALSTEEAEAMVGFILSLGEKKPSLPLKGTLPISQEPGKTGTYLLTAKYTDKGGTVVGPFPPANKYGYGTPWCRQKTTMCRKSSPNEGLPDPTTCTWTGSRQVPGSCSKAWT